MEQSSCVREFARYTILSVLGTLGVSCYILADTFFISRGLGTKGLASLNLAIPVYNFIHGTGLMLFSPAFILNNVFLCFVRNDEGPQLAMAAMLIGSFANIILDYLFIFPLQMGIFGAVFATGLSPLISIAVMIPHWLRKRNTFHWIKTGIRAEIAAQSLSLGFPSFVAQISSGLVMIVFNKIILQLKGNTGIAAYGIIANISLVVVAVYSGLAQGMQPLVSYFYGTGNQKRARVILGYAMIVMVVLSGIIYGFIGGCTQPIIAVFNSENNRELQEIAAVGLRLYFIASPFIGYNTILATFFTSIEKALPAHGLSLLRGFILIIPAAFALSYFWGITGVWLVYPVTECLVMLLGCAADRYYRKQML